MTKEANEEVVCQRPLTPSAFFDHRRRMLRQQYQNATRALRVAREEARIPNKTPGPK